MIYNHKEIKEKYKSDYQINKAIENKEIYKIETKLDIGVYKTLILNKMNILSI